MFKIAYFLIINDRHYSLQFAIQIILDHKLYLSAQMQEQGQETINFQQQQSCITHFPRQTHRKNPKHKKIIDPQLKQVIQYVSSRAQEMAERQLERTLKSKVLQVVIRVSDKQMFQNSRIKSSQRERQQTSKIIVLQVQRNQVAELEQFMDYLCQNLMEGKSDVISVQQAEQLRLCQFKNVEEVREIILKMHQRLDYSQKGKNYIFIPRKVTDLSEKNLYLFKKGLAGSTFKLVIATFEDLQNQAIDRQSTLGLQIEVYYVKLFDAKILFTEFMYNCLRSKDIKAYFPKQVVDLISDFDYYPLSYHCATFRLIYLLKKNIMLNKGQMKYVNFITYLKPIKNAFKNLCPAAYDQQQSIIQQRLIKTILTSGKAQQKQNNQPIGVLQNNIASRMRKDHINDKFIFTIPPLFEQLYQLKSAQQMSKLNRNEQFCIQIRKQIAYQYGQKIEQQKLNGGEQLDLQWFMDQIYIQEEQRAVSVNSRNSRSSRSFRRTRRPRNDHERYDYDPQNARNQNVKAIAQIRITNIIRKASQPLRQQAKKFKWQDYQFEWRIRPQLPRQIVANLIAYTSKSKDPRLKIINQLARIVIRNYAIDLKKFVEEYEYVQKNEGELMSVIKDLEIFGIVERSSKMSQLTFTNNFYQKSVYRT